MIRYEQRVPPGKLEVWAVEDWPEWNAPVGRTARKAVTYEEYVLFDGRLKIHAEGQPSHRVARRRLVRPGTRRSLRD